MRQSLDPGGKAQGVRFTAPPRADATDATRAAPAVFSAQGTRPTDALAAFRHEGNAIAAPRGAAAKSRPAFGLGGGWLSLIAR